MGLHDRDYYREATKEQFHGTGHAACKGLIALNLIAFLVQALTVERMPGLGFLLGNGPFTDALILRPGAVFDGQVWRVLTYAFIHAPDTLFHVGINMLVLWWFGTELEDRLGTREFVAFYLVAAVLSGAAQLASAALGFSGRGVGVLGASGAVFAVEAAFAVLYPRRTIYLFFVIPLEAWMLVALHVGLATMGVFGVDQPTLLNPDGARVAHEVHLGGALFGLAYALSGLRLLGTFRPRPGRARARPAPPPRLRVTREPEPVAAEPAAPEPPEPNLEAQLDAVLAKVQAHGQASLSESEREILFRASALYKKRRG